MKKSIFNKIKKNLSMVLVFSIILGCFLFYVSAKTNQNNLEKAEKQSIEKMVALSFASNFLDDNDKDSINLKNIFFESLKNNIFNIKELKNNLDFDNIKLLEINSEENIYRAIKVPVVGNEYSILSNFTVLYDLNNNILTYFENVIKNSSSNMFEIIFYEDGEKISEKLTNIEYISNIQMKDELKTLEDIGNDISISDMKSGWKSTGCLAATGLVSAGVISIITDACVGACVAVPSVCIACIGGYITVGASAITAIEKCF